MNFRLPEGAAMRSFFLVLFAWLVTLASPAWAAEGSARSGALDTLIVGETEKVGHPAPAHGPGPLTVRAALAYGDVRSFDDQDGKFNATVALRLIWSSPDLRYTASAKGEKYKEFSSWEADSKIATIWVPRIRFTNLEGELKHVDRNLRIFPDGTVELITRATGTFRTPVNISRFPYDRQGLDVEMAVHGDKADAITLKSLDADTAFSQTPPAQDLDGWKFGAVKMTADRLSDFDGNAYSRITASLDVERLAIESIVSLCLPLLASLVIPFLAIWLNSPAEDGFAVDAFELANVVIGGLFAVIALGITISSSSPSLVVEDNVVSRLLSLNYASLGFGILIVLALYQYNVIGRLFGYRAQARVHSVLSWLYPLSVSVIAAVIMVLPMR